MDFSNVKPNLNFFQVRSGFRSDANEIKELGDKIFGSGYLNSWFIQDSKLEDSIYLVAMATKIIGMIYFRRTKDLPENSSFLQCIMVDEKYRRKGVGTSLYNSALQVLTKRKISQLQASCWKESPQSGIIPFLEKEGWEISLVAEKYWYTDSLEMGYQCARCGSPCFCSAVLMSIDLPNRVAGGVSAPMPQG